MSPVMDPISSWIAARGNKRFTLLELVAATCLERRPALRVCDKLAREGYLAQVSEERIEGGEGPARRNPTWKRLKDPTARPRPERKRITKRDRMWRCMNDATFFTLTDLMLAIDDMDGRTPQRATCEEFLHMLRDAGYIRQHGHLRGNEKLWKLVKGRGQERPLLPDPNAERRRKARGEAA